MQQKRRSSTGERSDHLGCLVRAGRKNIIDGDLLGLAGCMRVTFSSAHADLRYRFVFLLRNRETVTRRQKMSFFRLVIAKEQSDETRSGEVVSVNNDIF